MHRMRAAALAALGIALICAWGCNGGKAPPQTAGCGQGEGPGPNHNFGKKASRKFEVYIYTPDPNNPSQCSVDWPVGTLWKGASANDSQTVTWFSDDNKQYTIDFRKGSNGSPFSSQYFTVPMGGSVNSGSLQPTASGYYSFAVLAGDASSTQICKKATDPDPGYYVK
jgi:hypothetical protein